MPKEGDIVLVKTDLEDKPKHTDSYVRNCLIKMRQDENNNYLFLQQDGIISCRLDGYAIVPRDEFERMESQLKYYRSQRAGLVVQ